MLSEVDVKHLTGLTSEEASRRFADEGPNELPASRKRSMWAIVLEVVREPMFVLLVGCGALYLLLGDTKAVSYTHLDVYKRQGQCSADSKNDCCNYQK